MAFRENVSPVRTIITDREFERLLERTSAILKAREFRLLRFPGKSAQKHVELLRAR